MWKRLIRSVLELVFAIAFIVFLFSQPTAHGGLRYFLASVAAMLLILLLLRKWP